MNFLQIQRFQPLRMLSQSGLVSNRLTVPMQQNVRVFNSSTVDYDRSSHEESFMKLDDGRNMQQRLMARQVKFDKSPKDLSCAYRYFRELNRNQKYATVLRLYAKYEADFRLSKDYELFQKVQTQYAYAQRNLDTMKSVAEKLRAKDAELTGRVAKNGILSIFIQRFPHLLGRVIFAYIAVAVFTWLIQNASKSMGDKYKFEVKKASEIKQRLDDVKGIDEIKEEVENIIKMIKDPSKYNEKGAKLHRGLMLFGEPGVGKTLLARAIAGEANVNFIFCTGSSFDEMWVGLGAKRVRELFVEARKNTPCIIFIDEIDSLLSKSRRQGGEGSSSRATINQLLTEMDGFEQTDNILVIGATNHEDSLDTAATRPGRFDKKVHVPHPDVAGRKDIFDLYLEKIARANDVNSLDWATMTPGFTGAEIENLVNTAITQAVHRGKAAADKDDFEYARDRIMMGIERKSLSMGEKERLYTAIHEAGHALVCYYNPLAKRLYKATIVARGPSLGATYMVPNESDMVSMSKDKILAEIDVAMGGHVAEKLFIGASSISSGCGSDLQGATKMATQAVRYFGMFGDAVSFISMDKNNTSDAHNADVDREVQKILDESFQRVSKLLQSRDKELRDLAKGLYTYDYLDADEMDKVISGKGIDAEKMKVRELKPEDESDLEPVKDA